MLITGAAGNMGTLLSRHLAGRMPRLRLMYHRTPLAGDVIRANGVEPVQADFGDVRTIAAALESVKWFEHLLEAGLSAKVRKVILASFPQVEGPTSFDHPATGRLDREPVSVHARTGLEEERLLIARTAGSATVPVVLRFGLVYERDVLLIEAARRLAHRGLLGVWREPTTLQLIAVPDYLQATEAAIRHPAAAGIYHGRRTADHDSGVPGWAVRAMGLPAAMARPDVDRAGRGRRMRTVRARRRDEGAADQGHRGARACAALGRYAPRTRRSRATARLSHVLGRASPLLNP